MRKIALQTVATAFAFLMSWGAHVPLASAADSCGGLDQDCCTSGPECNSPSLVCYGPYCVTCGGDYQPCCTGNQCDSGGICDGDTCEPCGAESEPCCDSFTCDPGLHCENISCDNTLHEDLASGGGATLGPEICVNCGDAGEPCCDGTNCNTGALCIVGTCESYGGDGEPCCDPDVCDTGFVCEPFCPGETLDGQGAGAAGTCPSEQLDGLPPSTVCRPCGGTDEPCCVEMSCDEGFICRMRYAETVGEGGGAEGFMNGSCLPCGALGEPCCEDSKCSGDNLLCGGEFCEACGGLGEQCCAANACPNSSNVCLGGVCNELSTVPAAGTWGIIALLLTLTGIAAFRLERG